MAARPLGVWGIDLGQCALKAIRLEMKDGQVVATAFEYIEHPKILSQPDADPDELSREALNQFLSRNKIKGDLIAISVPGQSGLARFVKLPPVDEKKIADIVKFEAKQQIPFPLEEVVWDFQRLNKGDIIDGLALETEIGLFAMKRDMVNRAIRQFKDVGVEVHVVQMAPLALCNFVAYDKLGKGTDNAGEDGDHECVVALEIGTDNSNLVITDGGRIIWQRPIPIGGNHFTRALTKEMKLTFAKAEHLKRNAAKSGSAELKKILSALKQVLNDFVGEVQRSLGYFTNTHRNAKIQYMVGLGNAFRLPGLQKFLQEKLQLEVRKLGKLERAGGESVTAAPTFSENIMSFGVAYGLALQGLKQARLQTNLLPYEVKLERVIRGKKPWAVTAAAVLAFGMFLMAYAAGSEKISTEDPDIGKAQQAFKEISGRASKFTADAKSQQDEMKKAKENLKRIGAGIDERMNWELLHQFVNMVTPQSNGGHLVNRSDNGVMVKSDYWDRDNNAKKAFAELEDKKFEKPGAKSPVEAQKRDEFIKKHLIQMNIVGVNTMYTDDLKPFFLKIHEDGPLLLGMSQDDKNKVEKLAKGGDAKDMPKSGWVVEIRGYTYHRDKAKFVEETLVQNLRNPEALAEVDPLSKKSDIKLTDELRAHVSKHVKFVHNYKMKTEERPQIGVFAVINQSYLPVLIKGNAQQGKGPGQGPMAMPGMDPKMMAMANPGANAANAGPNRDTWTALGEGPRMQGGIGQGPGVEMGMPAGKHIPAPPPNAGMPMGSGAAPKGKESSVPRTEFVVVFVWEEQIVTQLPGLTARPGGAAPAGPGPGAVPPPPPGQGPMPGNPMPMPMPMPPR
ncbi:MAG TPA: type IV pilus assembly protein PilM [Gemmataceae bacterium]|nr:type IV pilus assembly protein PilM [Gemmataceae bacterium]